MPRSRSSSDGAHAPCTVTVCRGCCCGTASKHPDVDHDEQVAALRRGMGTAGRLRVSDCLDACDRSNVVVVNPSGDGRRTGGRPIWLAGVIRASTVAEIVDWVRSGGPGIGDRPEPLERLTFRPSRQSRAAVRQ